MSKASFQYKEFRIVIEPETTEVFALLEAQGDCPTGVQGWHHKTFPKSISAVDALKSVTDAVLWPQEAPPSPAPPFVVVVDGKRIETTKPRLSGLAIRHAVQARDGWVLAYDRSPGSYPEEQIGDADVVDLTSGEVRLYTRPKATMGGNECV